MPHRLPEGENATPLEVIGTTASDKLVIIMVGLPATGKFIFALFACRLNVKEHLLPPYFLFVFKPIMSETSKLTDSFLR